jgi:acyl-CoA hydrolase
MDNQINMEPKKTVAISRTTMTEMVMPNDTNPLGNLMGGNLMRWMDIVAAIAAGKHCEAHVVTASVDQVSFDKAIKVGEIVTLDAKVTRAFNTSVEIYVEVIVADIKGLNFRRCNHAYFTFVALDDVTREPKKVPILVPLTSEEEKMFESALHRREIRLVQSGRIKLDDTEFLRKFLAQNEQPII